MPACELKVRILPKCARPACNVLVISETILYSYFNIILFYVRISKKNWNDKAKFLSILELLE